MSVHILVPLSVADLRQFVHCCMKHCGHRPAAKLMRECRLCCRRQRNKTGAVARGVSSSLRKLWFHLSPAFIANGQ
jgi:hypothetical protein